RKNLRRTPQQPHASTLSRSQQSALYRKSSAISSFFFPILPFFRENIVFFSVQSFFEILIESFEIISSYYNRKVLYSKKEIISKR
ncbi:MAG: hypothetical protein LUH20_03940, partial [Lachnospiraceae bacterium]|nr:hypothetical protein [Lachnospiraceae bacterium]